MHAQCPQWLNRDPIGENRGINLYGYVLNNSIGYVDLVGLDVTVSVYPGENHNPAGHIDIRVNNNAPVGFAPAPGASMTQVLLDNPVPGVMELTSPSRVPESTITIHTSPKQDAAIQAYLDRRTKNPGPYIVTSRNCATTVHNALSAGGIESEYTMRPRELIGDLIKRLQPK